MKYVQISLCSKCNLSFSGKVSSWLRIAASFVCHLHSDFMIESDQIISYRINVSRP